MRLLNPLKYMPNTHVEICFIFNITDPEVNIQCIMETMTELDDLNLGRTRLLQLYASFCHLLMSLFVSFDLFLCLVQWVSTCNVLLEYEYLLENLTSNKWKRPTYIEATSETWINMRPRLAESFKQGMIVRNLPVCKYLSSWLCHYYFYFF